MTPKKQHGGKRQNAGRKPPVSPTVTKSISMPEIVWMAFDEQRKGLSRGAYLLWLLENA
jgi:hypothetical protein